ncbi:MAG TPA: TRAP transporter small permease subunit [Beijerinckiaceae bacterium]|nr:TRAP transporter small permease subunit [Beijerinckiaceae bacterium]
MIRFYARVIDKLAAAALAGAAVLLAGMSLVVVYTVAQRYLLGRTPYWAEELPRLLLVWTAFLGAIAAAARGGHLSAGILPLIVRGEAPLRAISRVRLVAALVVCGVMAKAAYDLSILTAGQLTAAMQISASWSYAAAAVGFGGLGLVFLARTLSARPEA